MPMSLQGEKKLRVEGEKLGKHELATDVFCTMSCVQTLTVGSHDDASGKTPVSFFINHFLNNHTHVCPFKISYDAIHPCFSLLCLFHLFLFLN